MSYIKYRPVIRLMNRFCRILAEIERNGMKIDVAELDRLDHETEKEINQLTIELNTLAQGVWGDEPININSPEQLSQLIYSVCVRDKKLWAQRFGIGKDKRRRRISNPEFRKIIAELLYRPVKKVATTCDVCDGSGSFQKFKKDGTLYKNLTKCTDCNGSGIVYVRKQPLEVAGFSCGIPDPKDATANGFSTNKDKLEELAKYVEKENAKEFLQKMVRLNALSTYKTTFVDGIRRSLRRNDMLYPNFSQCIARNGRLSSSNPNIHNQPRGATFPIRRCFISRWEGGKITKGDYKTLEFVVAAELSRDEVAIQDIKDGVDTHTRSSEIMTDAGQSTNRQEGKAHTFKPLFGGVSGTRAETAYYKWFLEHYSRIAEWHESLLQDACTFGTVSTPSGRTYAFPHARKTNYGSVVGATKIKNYPVSGFATADIVPISTIRLQEEIWRLGLQSVIINEVHDENVVDTHPKEINIIPRLMYNAMYPVQEFVKEWYDYDFITPVGVEISQGSNWLDTEEVEIK